MGTSEHRHDVRRMGFLKIFEIYKSPAPCMMFDGRDFPISIFQQLDMKLGDAPLE